jgi:hypothetical protein
MPKKMKKSKFLYSFEIFSIIFLTVFIILFSLFINGCASKPEVIVKTKYVYVKPKLYKLKTYEYNKTMDISATVHNGKVCVKQWGGCISKKAFINIATYIKELKGNLQKCNTEIKNYNKLLEDLNLSM